MTRGFITLSRAWYVATAMSTRDCIDEIYIAFRDDVRLAEVYIRWYSTGRGPMLTMEVSDDAWWVFPLPAFQKLQWALTDLCDQTVDGVETLLLELGFEDQTPTKR